MKTMWRVLLVLGAMWSSTVPAQEASSVAASIESAKIASAVQAGVAAALAERDAAEKKAEAASEKNAEAKRHTSYGWTAIVGSCLAVVVASILCCVVAFVFLISRMSRFEDFQTPLPDQTSHQALLDVIGHDAPKSLNHFWVQVQEAHVLDHLAYGDGRHVACAFNIGSGSDDQEKTLDEYSDQDPYFLVEAARNPKGAWVLYAADVNPKAIGLKDVQGWLDECFQKAKESDAKAQEELHQQQINQASWKPH